MDQDDDTTNIKTEFEPEPHDITPRYAQARGAMPTKEYLQYPTDIYLGGPYNKRRSDKQSQLPTNICHGHTVQITSDVRVTPEDPERNDVLRLEGMDNDFVDPERNNILQLKGMRRESGLLILINNGFTLLVIFRYLYKIRCYSAEQPKDTGVFSCAG